MDGMDEMYFSNEEEKYDKNDDEDELKGGLALKLKRDSLSMLTGSKSRSSRDSRVISESSKTSYERFQQRSKQLRKSVFFISDQLQQSLNVHTAAELSIKRREYEDKEEIEIRSPKPILMEHHETPFEEFNWKVFRLSEGRKFVYRWVNSHREISIIFVSVFVAVVIGVVLRVWDVKLNALELYLVTFPGKFYYRMMMGILVPLLSTSIISSIGKMELNMEKKLIRHFMFFVVISNAMAIGLSVLVMYLLTPGIGFVANKATKLTVVRKNMWDTFTDILINMMANNGVLIFLNSTLTDYVYVGPDLIENSKLQQTLLDNPDNWFHNKRYGGKINYIGIITLSTVIGFILLPFKRKDFNPFVTVDCLERALEIILDWFSWFAPVGKFFLFLDFILKIDTVHSQLLSHQLRDYALSYFITTAIHMFVVIPFFICLITRINPWQFIKRNACLPVIYTSVCTSSSLATVPTTVQWLEKEANIGPVEARLFVPLGVVISKNGSAIWFTMTAIFIAQALELRMTFWTLLAICANSVVAIFNATPVPVGIPELRGVLDIFLPLGVPVEEFYGISAPLTVLNGFLDRFLTLLNVYADLAGLMAVQQLKLQTVLGDEDLLTWEEIIQQQESAKRISLLQTEYIAKHQDERTSQNEDDLRVISVTSLDIKK